MPQVTGTIHPDRTGSSHVDALTQAQTRIINTVLDGGLVGNVPIRSLIPDMPPGAPVQFDRSTTQDDLQTSRGVTFVDPDHSRGPVLKFLRPTAGEPGGLLRVQLLMTFDDTEPLPLGEMQIRFNTTTGELTQGTGLAY